VKKSNTLIIALFIGLGVLLVLYFTLNENGKRYQWNESYKTSSDQPYGTLFIQKLLARHKPDQKFILNDKKPLRQILDTAEIKTETDYVFIGQDIFLEDDDKSALLNFIFSGNDAFIATVHLPFEIIDLISISECDDEIFLEHNEALEANLNFFNTNLKTENGYAYRYRYGKTDQSYFWNTLNPEFFCDSMQSTVPLGYIHPDKINFFRFSHGKGNLYIHTNPLVFTNYFLTKPDKTEYVSSVFSYLQGEAIIWDEFSKLQLMPGNNAPEISPVSYILQQDSLRYGWWLMLASALLYSVFAAKRKQRIIPVLEEKTNTSLEFVNMISALHFQNGNHHDMARKKMKYFFYFIRGRYGIQIQMLTEGYQKRIAEKSKVELHILELIAHVFNHVEREPDYNANKLVDLHNALEKFYKHCK
jgi:hypothetical protein